MKAILVRASLAFAFSFALLGSPVRLAPLAAGDATDSAAEADARIASRPKQPAEANAHAMDAASFLQRNCSDCHLGRHADGGFDLDRLSTDLSNPSSLARWVRVFDRVQDGEMPPPEYGELDKASRERFVADTGAWIRREQRAEFDRLGRVPTRRLSNRQLERTLHDLLAIRRPLTTLMPTEQKVDGFTGIAESQSMSHFHLQDHLSVVDAALDAAFQRLALPPDQDHPFRRELDTRRIARDNPRRRCRDPEMRDGVAVIWASKLIFYGRISNSVIPKSGWYRIRLKASAVRKPDDHGVWCSVRSGRCTSGAPLMTWIGSFEATDQVQEFVYDAWIPKDHMLEIRPCDETLKQGRFAGGQVGAGEGESQDIAGVGFHELTIEEIHPEGERGRTRDHLFGDLKLTYRPHAASPQPNAASLRQPSKDKDNASKNESPKIESTRRGKRSGRRASAPLVMTLAAEHSPDDLVMQLRRFAARAWRRPVVDAAIEPYAELLRTSLRAGDRPIDALRLAYRAVLCSPRFLYFAESPGKLDGYETASRLSYLLWESMPDEELFGCAADGRLGDAEERYRQVERMLRHRRGADFIARLADRWLDLDQIDFTEPDRRRFGDFDNVVKNAMLAETRLTLGELFDADRPAAELVTCRTTFLNRRLARYYGLTDLARDQGVDGRMTRVELPDDSHRGGILTQGAVLKVTANGTNTSPVVRGVWVSERLLGEPISDPPESVPAIEPDTRGATTIRELLDKHKSDASCASCHVKIDPPGFALENFDAAGRWRDHYRVGFGRGSKRGSRIDASAVMPDGRPFDDVDQFRRLCAERPESIARCFAEHVLTFGTGRPPQFSDRDALQQIVDQTRSSRHGLRSLVHAAVNSPIFLRK